MIGVRLGLFAKRSIRYPGDMFLFHFGVAWHLGLMPQYEFDVTSQEFSENNHFITRLKTDRLRGQSGPIGLQVVLNYYRWEPAKGKRKRKLQKKKDIIFDMGGRGGDKRSMMSERYQSEKVSSSIIWEKYFARASESRCQTRCDNIIVLSFPVQKLKTGFVGAEFCSQIAESRVPLAAWSKLEERLAWSTRWHLEFCWSSSLFCKHLQVRAFKCQLKSNYEVLAQPTNSQSTYSVKDYVNKCLHAENFRAWLRFRRWIARVGSPWNDLKCVWVTRKSADRTIW